MQRRSNTMTFDPTDYIPHGLVTIMASVGAWVFQNHVKEDKDRFKQLTAAIERVDTKLDDAVAQTAKNHAEILRILLDRKNV